MSEYIWIDELKYKGKLQIKIKSYCLNLNGVLNSLDPNYSHLDILDPKPKINKKTCDRKSFETVYLTEKEIKEIIDLNNNDRYYKCEEIFKRKFLMNKMERILKLSNEGKEKTNLTFKKAS